MRWQRVVAVGVAAICLCLAGVAVAVSRDGADPHPAAAHAISGQLTPASQAIANRDRATAAARRLLGLAVIPPGALKLTAAPAATPGPALGLPSGYTYVDLSAFYQVPMDYLATVAFVHAHQPAGLSTSGSGGEGTQTLAAFAWQGADPDDPTSSGQLSEVVAPKDALHSYLRLDAGHYWLDPRPIKDTAAGLRLRIEAGQSCPASDAGIVGVRNIGAGLTIVLAPRELATAGRLCSYAGLNGNRFSLLRQRNLDGADAARIAGLASHVDLSHPDESVPRSCPMSDGTAQVLVLDYPDRSAINLWLPVNGCRYAGNGTTLADGSLSLTALFDAVGQLDR